MVVLVCSFLTEELALCSAVSLCCIVEHLHCQGLFSHEARKKPSKEESGEV